MVTSKENPNQGNPEIAKREQALSAVIATNAVISPEQFELLKNALGKEVVMEYNLSQYLADEDSNYDVPQTEKFTLKNFNFVEDEKTGIKYLAFFRNLEDDATYFPFWNKKNFWDDSKSIRINRLTLSSGELLWTFDQPKKSIPFNSIDSSPEPKIDWQIIKDNSKSALSSEKIGKQISLESEEQITGTTDNFVSLKILKRPSLESLSAFVGKPIKIHLSEEKWIYEGPDDNEDHSEYAKNLEGTLTKVNEKEVEIAVEKGEEVWPGTGSVHHILPCSMRVPFKRHEFNLKRSAGIIQIIKITTSDSTSFVLDH
jgi:hypothetical protein